MTTISRKEIVTLEIESDVFDSIMFILGRVGSNTPIDGIDSERAKSICDDLKGAL